MDNAVDMVVEKLGGVTKTARLLGVANPSVIANWRARGRIPPERVLEIEALSGISRHIIRPDVFGTAPIEAAE